MQDIGQAETMSLRDAMERKGRSSYFEFASSGAYRISMEPVLEQDQSIWRTRLAARIAVWQYRYRVSK